MGICRRRTDVKKSWWMVIALSGLRCGISVALYEDRLDSLGLTKRHSP